MRPYWKGYLKLALVSCPIALHAACSTSERIAFRQVNKATGHRLRQQLIDEETREPVTSDQKGRGYEIAKGQYLMVEEEELEKIEIESTHVIDIDSFVPRQEIDQRFFDTPYYVTPNEPVKLAEHIVDSKVGSFDPVSFRDRYEEALLAHLKAKEAGAVREEKSVFSAPRRFVNLMDALRRSIAQDKRSIAPDKKPPRKDNASVTTLASRKRA